MGKPDSELGPLFANTTTPLENKPKVVESAQQQTGSNDSPDRDRVLSPQELRERFEKLRTRLRDKKTTATIRPDRQEATEKEQPFKQFLVRLGGRELLFSWPTEEEMEDYIQTTRGGGSKKAKNYGDAKYINDLKGKPGWVKIEFWDGTTGVCQRTPGQLVSIWLFRTSEFPYELKEWE